MRVVATPAWCRACFDVFGSRARVSESVWLRLGNLRELRRRVRIPGGSRDQTCTETDTQTTAWNQPHPGTGQGRQGPARAPHRKCYASTV